MPMIPMKQQKNKNTNLFKKNVMELWAWHNLGMTGMFKAWMVPFHFSPSSVTNPDPQMPSEKKPHAD